MFIDTFFPVEYPTLASLPAYINWNTDELPQSDLAITSLKISNGKYDALYIQQGVLDDYENWDGTIPILWEWNTVLDAQFNHSLNAGSIEASVNVTSEVRIKRRLKGDFRWQTLFVQPITTVKDFEFEWYDNTVASNTEYEYTYIPVINGSEGSLSSAEVEVSFSDYFLVGQEQSYHIIVNSANTPTYNQETGIQTTIGRKYPYIIKNGNVGYYSGTLEGVIVSNSNDESCTFDFNHMAKFQREFDFFLTDGRAKILKDWKGNIWIVFVTDSISRNTGDHYNLEAHSINWVECGDAFKVADLYDYGFIDTDLDR